MDHLDLYALRRQNALLARRLELVESILEVTGIIDAARAGRSFEGVRGARPGDPASLDLRRLSKAQLEATLRGIAAERNRLDAFESMIQDEMTTALAPTMLNHIV